MTDSRIHVSGTLGAALSRAATARGTSMRAVLEQAIVDTLDDIAQRRAAIAAELSFVPVASMLVAFHGTRFAGVAFDTGHPEFPPLVDWCAWFKDLCATADVAL